MGRTLRVSLLGLKVPEPRKYHVSVQVLGPGQAPSGVVVLSDTAEASRPDRVARTETAPFSQNPEFLNRVFVLRLPEPLGNSLSPQLLLHCNLFAAPSMDSTTPGAIVAGKEVDELVGSATLQIRGDVAARLLRGERVTLPVLLSARPGAVHGAIQEKVQDAMSASMYGAQPGAKELLLELMLLDAGVPLPRDTYALRASYGAPVTGGTQLGGGTGPLTGSLHMSRGPVEATLLVLVARAENLPTIRGQNGAEVSPSTFVAAKSLRDVRNRVEAQSVTAVVPQTCNPVYAQLLQVKYLEGELQEEALQLAIVNDDNSLLMLTANLPLAALLPRVHYNLKLLIPGGPLGTPVSLFVTLCLTSSPRREARHLKALASSGVTSVVEARLAASSLPLGALLKQHQALGSAQEGNQGGASDGATSHSVLAVWRYTNAATPPPTPPQQPTPTSSDGSAPAAEAPAATRTAVALPAPLPVDAVYTPVDVGGPPSAATQVLTALSDSFDAAAPQLGFILEAVPLAIIAGGSSTPSADALVWPPDHMAMLLGKLQGAGASKPAGLSLELHALSAGAANTTPLASVHVPGEKVARASSTSMPVEQLPLKAAAAKGVTCTVEVARWDSPAYQEHLLKGVPPEGDHGSLVQQDGMLSMTAWQDKGSMMGGTTTGSAITAAAAALETLVDDMLVKQLALERLARSADTLDARADIIGWRLRDAEQRAKTLQEDNASLRQLLHEEKEATRLPAGLPNAATLTRDQLIEHAEAALAAYGRERRRNMELVHRLQQLHGEQVDVLEMKKRYHELQAAHMEQTKLMSESGSNPAKLAAYRATVKTQEEVIANLEILLAQAVAKAKSVPALQAEVNNLRTKVAELEGRPPPVLIQQQPKSPSSPLVKQMDELKGRVRDMDSSHEELASENVQLKLKLKQAEERTGAARDELIAAIKRYASEIADLKWKLAEKDAQLMGGFGSPARLMDLDDDLGIPHAVVGGAARSPLTGTPPHRTSSLTRAGGRVNSADSAATPTQRRSSQQGGAGTPGRITLSAGGVPDGGLPALRRSASQRDGSGVGTPDREAGKAGALSASASFGAASGKQGNGSVQRSSKQAWPAGQGPPLPGSPSQRSATGRQQQQQQQQNGKLPPQGQQQAAAEDDDDEEEEDDDEEEEEDEGESEEEEEDDEEEEEEEETPPKPPPQQVAKARQSPQAGKAAAAGGGRRL